MPSARVIGGVAAACMAVLVPSGAAAVTEQAWVGAGAANALPEVLVDAAGTTYAAWTADPAGLPPVPQVHVRRRTVGEDGFEPDRVLTGFPAGLTVDPEVALVEDRPGHRLLLFVGGTLASADLVTYVVVSTDGGLHWSSPTPVFDDLVGTDFTVRPTDGAIAVTPGTDGVQRLLIPPSLPPQSVDDLLTPAGNALLLSDRILSRQDIAQGFGPDGTSYTMFEGGTGGGWVHVGSATAANDRADAGRERDRPLGAGTLAMDIASGPKGAGILTAPSSGDGPLLFHPLSPAGAGSPVPVPLAPDAAHGALPRLLADAEGNLVAVWRGDGRTVFSRRSTDGGATWGALHTLPSSGLDDGLLTDGEYSVGGPGGARGAFIYRDADRQVRVLWFDPSAVDTAAVTGPAVGATDGAPGGGPVTPRDHAAHLRALAVRGHISVASLRGGGLAVRINVSGTATARLRLSGADGAVAARGLVLHGGTTTVLLRAPHATRGPYRMTLTVADARRTVLVLVR